MKYYTLEAKKDFKGKYGQMEEGLIVEKKSKFYSYLFKINNEEEAIENIEKVKKDNIDARHVVYIYSIENNGIANIKFSDDGEPQGTGTRAIYELLEKERITNICIVIVRYFGGILLGAGPLSRTYLNSAKIVIDECSKKEIFNYNKINFIISYNGYNIFKNKIDKYLRDDLVIITDCDFNEKVKIELQVVDFEKENIKKIIEEINYGF